MAAWLLKSEPNEYSYTDLEKEGTSEWDGVTNPTAQMHMRAMQVGDTCVFYHSGGERAAIGIAKVVRAPYPDPTDEKGKRVWVDLQAEHALTRPVSLTELKADPGFATSPLVKMSRLSVVPLDEVQLATIERLGGA